MKQTMNAVLPVLLFFLLPLNGLTQSSTTKRVEPYLPAMHGFKMVNKKAGDTKLKSDVSNQEVDVVNTNYTFKYSPGSGHKPPTVKQLSEFYAPVFEKAAGRKSGEFRGVPGKEFYAAFYVRNGREIAINISEFVKAPGDSVLLGYTIHYLESPEKGYFKAEALESELKKTGRVVLDIRFESGSNRVKEESLAQVNELVTTLRKDPSLKISIEGHTDKLGSAAENMELSEARAMAVEDILREEGIDAARLSTKGWGWTKPVADNKTEAGRAKNRRVEIVKK